MTVFHIEIDAGHADVQIPLLYLPLFTADWLTMMVEHVGFAAWAAMAEA
jgi:hypothetical protein